MLTPLTRAVHRFTALAYLGFGGLLFFAPAWAAERFPWTVTPFVAMTIGGWCIGVTCFSWIGGRRGPIGAVLPVLTFVWLFGLSEIVVLLLDKPVFEVGAPLAVPYVLSLALTLASGGFGLLELVHRSRRGEAIHGDDSEPLDRAVRVVLLAVAALLGSLALAAFFAGTVSSATSGKVFPEPVTLFTVRAFGALNLSLGLGALIAARQSRSGSVWLALAGGFLVVPTLIAALANLSTFDLSNRPLGALYVGVYLVLLCLLVPFVWRHRRVLSGSRA